MNKYKVSADNIEHFQELEIEASERSEAVDIYLEFVNKGKVLTVKSEFINIKVKVKSEKKMFSKEKGKKCQWCNVPFGYCAEHRK